MAARSILSLRYTEDSSEKSKRNSASISAEIAVERLQFPERGKCLMTENIVDKAEAQVAESIRKLTRATSAMAEAIDEGVGAIKLAVKRSGDLAEEMIDDTTQRVKRHPVESVVATFTLGLIVGGFIGWMASRK
jgi:hypothetical protein